MKKLSILGSTGSIGTNTLSIIDMFPENFRVVALAAGKNIHVLANQINRFRPEVAVVLNEELAKELKPLLSPASSVEILYGDEGYRIAATHPDADMIIAAIVGGAGLMPTLHAIESGKDIALANKETLVMAGDIVMRLALEKGVAILPVDSEHSAIFQCLVGQQRNALDKIFLTASGGPFLNRPKEDFQNIKPEHALKHPTWLMGQKITIDSATLMNKGLEVIEAAHLFELSAEQIEVVIHPQSIVHSMVAFHDGSVIAQLGIPDMKTAIAYALTYPERLPLKQPVPDFTRLKSLSFESPDMEKFPCLALAIEACRVGNTLPAVMNAANEIAVHAFLNHRISFAAIPDFIQKTMEAHHVISNPSLDNIIDADRQSRDFTEKQILKLNK